MANQPTQTGFDYLTNQPPELDNPLQAMHRKLMQDFKEHGFTVETTSPKAGEQASQSPTRRLQVSFIPAKRTDQT